VNRGVIRVALIQSRIEGGYRENLARVRDIASTSSSPDLLALYENWPGRSPVSLEAYLDSSLEILETSGARVLVAGSAYIDVGRGAVSRTVIIDDRGLRAFGGKSFPSAATGERERIFPGGPPAIMETLYGYTVSSIVCVDAIYPEVVRLASLAGAEVVVNPSIIPSNRSYLWRALGSLRAAENTVFFIHVNPTNMRYFDGREVAGGSFIADPQGRIAAEAGPSEGLFEARIDLGEVARVRSRWVYLEDVRGIFSDIYSEVLERLRSRAQEL